MTTSRLTFALLLMIFGLTLNAFGQRPPEMNLKHIGNTDWPAGGAVSPK
jgi:hypothetical protein